MKEVTKFKSVMNFLKTELCSCNLFNLLTTSKSTDWFLYDGNIGR